MAKNKGEKNQNQSSFLFNGKGMNYILYGGVNPSLCTVDANANGKDPNRELMIKFKYDLATEQDIQQFHENVKKLIYKAIHSNRTNMDFNDLYQEIWKKIIKSKNSWNEQKDIQVSTWIVCVANSVINGCRSKINQHNSRYCLYDDIYPESEDENERDFLSRKVISEENPYHKTAFSDDYNHFYESLNDNERKVLRALYEINSNSRIKKYGKIPYRHIRNKLSLKQDELLAIIDGLKSKFVGSFKESISINI